MADLTYAVVTPARNEATNLARLAASLAGQIVLPTAWVIVDNGSTDETPAVVQDLAAKHEWVETITLPGENKPVRGGAVVRAFHAGLVELGDYPDILVKLDADVSFEPRYFERLLVAFADDPDLGIASGACQEERDGRWETRHVTRGGAWGAARAYRRGCLHDVLPLEERIGWDGVDEFKAQSRGWSTSTIPGISFRHHRKEGERDGRGVRRWAAAGLSMYYMGYRVSYLLFRAAFRAPRDPAALVMVASYVWAAVRREQRCRDPEAVQYVRDRQRLRELPRRIREASGRA